MARIASVTRVCTARKRGSKKSMVGRCMADRTRSGMFVGPGAKKNGRPDIGVHSQETGSLSKHHDAARLAIPGW
jgi:hypothetical protein